MNWKALVCMVGVYGGVKKDRKKFFENMRKFDIVFALNL